MNKPLLHIRAPGEGTRIEVLDPALQPIALPHNTGETKLEVDPGLYAVRFRRELAVTEKLAWVGKDDKEVLVTLEVDEEPIFATAAPVLQQGEQRSPQQVAAERLSRETPHVIGTSSDTNGSLLLFFRCDGPSGVRLDSGVTLHRESAEELVHVEKLAESDSTAGWAGLHLSLPAGAYRLRRKLEAAPVEQILYVRPQWQTQFFAKVLPQEATVDYALLSVLMAQATRGFDGTKADARYAEAALRALRERSSIPGPMSESMLEGKFHNPLLGILAALLQLRRSDLDVADFKVVLNNLVVLMGSVPDVLALGLALMTRDPGLRDDKQMRERFCVPAVLGLPPYFSDSWRHIVAASEWHPELIPDNSLAARAATSLARTIPWFRWRTTTDLAVPAPTRTALIESQSFWANIGNAALNLIGITAQSVQDFSAKTLSHILKSIQDSLAHFDDVAELLASQTFDDLDRRIAGFVFPLTDAALIAFLEGFKDHGAALRESVLARGRDSRELARVLQLPLLTAIFRSASLFGKLNTCQREIAPAERVSTFVEEESHGSDGLRTALWSLASRTASARHSGTSREVDLLEYLVLRYIATASKQPLRLPLLDVHTSQPIDSRRDNQILSTARRKLRSEVSLLIATGEVRENRPAGARSAVATLRNYQPGKLFPALEWPQNEPAVTVLVDTTAPEPKLSDRVQHESAPAGTAGRTPAAENPWARSWTIVHSDLDIAHVAQTLTDFTLRSANGTSQGPAYRLVNNVRAPTPDYFAEALLCPAGQHMPTFFDITGIEQLPMYSRDTVAQYVEISEKMGAYLSENVDVQRLEGVIRIPCHAPDTLTGRPHAPLTVNTKIEFYQFPNVVQDSLPLLVMRTPLSSLCPTNADGTAIGIGRR